MAHCQQVREAEIDGKPWYHDIREYLKNGIYPPEATENDKRSLKRLATSFFLSGVILYKRSIDSTLLRCVDDSEAREKMEEVHGGAFDTHANGHALARKILRVGYYWSKMESNYCQHVKRCMKCQMYVDNIHMAPSALHNLTSPWPFSMWGLDMIGPIEPKASNGHRFILVAIDYFTKWVEATSYANIIKSMVIKFIKRDIICRYGLLARIITDNGTNLNNKMMIELCEQFKIKHHNSTPFCPKMNRANRPRVSYIIVSFSIYLRHVRRLKTCLSVTYKDWHDMLPYALHEYRTSVCTPTGATPYSLVYGTEVVLPVEVEILSLRVLTEAELDEPEWAQSLLDQLNLIEEKRLTAICHGIRIPSIEESDLEYSRKGTWYLRRGYPTLKTRKASGLPITRDHMRVRRLKICLSMTYKDLHDMLPYALHEYRTSVCTPTGATPYSLVYGTEAVLPVEVEILSLRVLTEAELDEPEWVQSLLDQLNLIEEKRLTVICYEQLYQRRIRIPSIEESYLKYSRKGTWYLRRGYPTSKTREAGGLPITRDHM
ncbi:Retrovirus-related Pol polyprotein, partial [Mucuna pruriens]